MYYFLIPEGDTEINLIRALLKRGILDFYATFQLRNNSTSKLNAYLNNDLKFNLLQTLNNRRFFRSELNDSLRNFSPEEVKKILKKYASFLVEGKDFPKKGTRGGKGKILKLISSNPTNIYFGVKPIRYFVLTDLDEHIGETPQSVIGSIKGALEELYKDYPLINIELSQLDKNKFPGIYTFSSSHPDFKICLHIANFPDINNNIGKFIKSTIDDYILKIALMPDTLNNLHRYLTGEYKYRNRLNIKTPDVIKEKVVNEIRELLKNNGISLNEAKEFIRIYTIVTLFSPHLPSFAGEIISYASDEDLKEVFASLIESVNYLKGDI